MRWFKAKSTPEVSPAFEVEARELKTAWAEKEIEQEAIWRQQGCARPYTVDYNAILDGPPEDNGWEYTEYKTDGSPIVCRFYTVPRT